MIGLEIITLEALKLLNIFARFVGGRKENTILEKMNLIRLMVKIFKTT